MTQVTGGCHCGKLRFEADVDTAKAIECNCTYCAKTGALLSATSRDQFAMTSGDGQSCEYLFHKNVLAHQFCPTCGINVVTYGDSPDGQAMAAINLRCVDGIDLASIDRLPFDGLSL